MNWKKLILVFFIIFFFGYIFYPSYTKPEYFVFTDSHVIEFYDEPYINCSYTPNFFGDESKILINGCEVINVPKGKPYIYKSSPFHYSILNNQWKIFFILLIISFIYAFWPHVKANLINKGILKED